MSQTKAVLVNLGFTVADGEDVRTIFDDSTLRVQFKDWTEANVEFLCYDVIAFRWQTADYPLCENERDDSTYEVVGSAWLRDHVVQNCTWGELDFHHFKLNFNAAGVLEVLCTRIEKTAQPGATDNPVNAPRNLR